MYLVDFSNDKSKQNLYRLETIFNAQFEIINDPSFQTKIFCILKRDDNYIIMTDAKVYHQWYTDIDTKELIQDNPIKAKLAIHYEFNISNIPKIYLEQNEFDIKLKVIAVTLVEEYAYEYRNLSKSQKQAILDYYNSDDFEPFAVFIKE